MDIFWNACRDGDLATVQRWVAEGCTLKDVRSNNNRALRVACHNGHLPVIKYLVSQGLTLGDLRKNNSALSVACIYGHLHVAEYLVTQGLNVEDFRYGNSFAFWVACEHSHLPVVKFLLSRGLTSCDVRDSDNSALHAAYRSMNRDCELLQTLIWAGQYTQSEVTKIIQDPATLNRLIFEQPEPAFEDLVKPGVNLQVKTACTLEVRDPHLEE